MECRSTLVFISFFSYFFPYFPTFFGFGGGVSCCLQHCAVLGGDLKSVFNSCVTEKPLSSYLTRK